MTEKTTRPTTTAGELTAGQHIILRGVTETLCHVDHVHPFRRASNSSRQVMLLMTEASGDDTPFTRTWPADSRVTLATPEDLAVGEVASRRAALVAALRQLADDIEDRELPVPRYGIQMSAVLDSYAAVEVWAQHLGVEIKRGGTKKDIPAVKWESGDALTVSVQTTASFPDAVTLDVAAGVERAEAVQAEVDALGVVDPEPTQVALTVPKHYHQGGSTGGPGGSSAGCGCGATFSGFASHAEAMAALNEHIAAMDAQAGE